MKRGRSRPRSNSGFREIRVNLPALFLSLASSVVRVPKSVFRIRIGQVVEIDRDTVAIDPRSADAETVEACANVFVPRREVEAARLIVQADVDLPVAVRAFRIVVQKPVVDLPVGINAWRLSAIVPERSPFVAVRAIHRIKKEAFTRRAFDVDPDIIHRYRLFLRRMALHAVLRMVKTNRRRAVTDRAQDGDFPARLEPRLERQRSEPISVRGHAARFTAVAAKDQSTQFARLLPVGVASLAPAKIEPRPRVRAHVAATVVEGIPFRVVTEIEGDPVDRHVVEPDLAGVIPCLEDGQETEVSDGESLAAAMCRLDLTPRGCAVQVEDQQALASRPVWIIDHLP